MTTTRQETSSLTANNSTNYNSNNNMNKFERLIDDKFRVGAKIGSGSYGQIRLGTNIRTGQVVAIKFESINSDRQLHNEYQCYSILLERKGFPIVHFFGRYDDQYEVLVMERLARNLDTLFEDCGRKFTLKSLIFIALQLLKRFETIHTSRIIYRDVKPENFMLGTNTNTIFIIDFGLSTIMTDSNRIGQSTNELIGTSRYMSINAHQCKAQSRRDDLESIGYVFVYFLRGKLPWSGLKANNFKEHNQMIVDRKRSISPEELCDGHPHEFLYYLKYVRSLDFDSIPNYEKLRNMFKRRFHLEQFSDDGIYDWNKQSIK